MLKPSSESVKCGYTQLYVYQVIPNNDRCNDEDDEKRLENDYERNEDACGQDICQIGHVLDHREIEVTEKHLLQKSKIF